MGPLIDAYCASANACVVTRGNLYESLHMLVEAMGWRHEYDAARALLRGSMALPLPVDDERQVLAWIIDSYMAERDYDAVVAACQEMIVKYPGSQEASWAQFDIAKSRALQGRYADAKEAYQKVISDNPGTPLAAHTQERIDELPE